MNLSEPGLDRAEADRALERLGAESDRIAEALVAMDGHPGHQLLRAATLTGATLQKWAETSTAMATLWEQFAAYRTLLDRAREVRARRARPGQAELEELTELLTGKVVELNSEQVPIEQRGLTGPALTTERITLTELVDRMKATFATVTGVLADADTATAEALRRIDPLDAELRDLIILAERISLEHLEALAKIRERLAETRVQVATDPLGTRAADPLGTMTAELTAIRARLAELGTVRETVDERLAQVGAALGKINSIQAEARTVHATVLAKIANPGLAPLVDHASAVRARLDGVRALRKSADLTRLAAELEALDDAASTALARATEQLEAGAGLLDRRSELRGRLDAYRAKAERLGRAEDLGLAALHGTAHDLLYTSPCDLPAATRAVNRYQQAVQEGLR